MASGMVSIRFGAKGPNYATVSACASSGHALGDAMRILQRGDADVMLTGGTEAAITPLCIAGFASMRAMSTRNEDPSPHPVRSIWAGRIRHRRGSGGSRSGDRGSRQEKGRSDPGRARRVRRLRRRLPHHRTRAESACGAQYAMRAALRDAGAEPADVDYINAHGTSTPHNDAMETMAIKAVFGEHAMKMVVGSTKSMVGHLLGAAGATEAVISALVTREGKIPPTINFSDPDPDCDLDYAHNHV